MSPGTRNSFKGSLGRLGAKHLGGRPPEPDDEDRGASGAPAVAHALEGRSRVVQRRGLPAGRAHLELDHRLRRPLGILQSGLRLGQPWITAEKKNKDDL